jgi:hypothetical protein
MRSSGAGLRAGIAGEVSGAERRNKLVDQDSNLD